LPKEEARQWRCAGQFYPFPFPFPPFAHNAHAQLSLGKVSAALPLSSSASPLSRCAAVFLAAESRSGTAAEGGATLRDCEEIPFDAFLSFLNCFIAGRRRRACFRRQGVWSAIVKRQVASSHLPSRVAPESNQSLLVDSFRHVGISEPAGVLNHFLSKDHQKPKGNSSLPTVSCRGPAPPILTLTLKGASRAASSPPERTIRRRKDASKSPCRNKTACSLEETADTTASAGGFGYQARLLDRASLTELC
jgi:hypothetical protein